jgi:hypothetical protein
MFNIFAGTSMLLFTTTALLQQFSNCYVDDLERKYKKDIDKLAKIEDWRNKEFIEQIKEFPKIIK